MNKIIKTDADYQSALARLENLLDKNPRADSPDSDEAELLTLLIQDYESRHFEFSPPNPVEAIKFRMEQQGLRPGDLVPFIGARSKVSEVLSGKRPLSISMIRALHAGLNIPLDVLIQDAAGQELVAGKS